MALAVAGQRRSAGCGSDRAACELEEAASTAARRSFLLLGHTEGAGAAGSGGDVERGVGGRGARQGRRG